MTMRQRTAAGAANMPGRRNGLALGLQTGRDAVLATGLATGLVVALLTGLWPASARAVAVAGPGGTADQGRRLVVATPAPGAVAPTLDLVAARLEAVDLAGGTVTVRGQRVPLHATALRVLGSGGQDLGARQLRAGQSVRLALEPAATGAAPVGSGAASAGTATPARRIVLIYIDG